MDSPIGNSALLKTYFKNNHPFMKNTTSFFDLFFCWKFVKTFYKFANNKQTNDQHS